MKTSVCGSTQNAARSSSGHTAGSWTRSALSTLKPLTGAKSQRSRGPGRIEAMKDRAVATRAVSRDAGASQRSMRRGSSIPLARTSVATTAETALHPVSTALRLASILPRSAAMRLAYAGLSERSMTSAPSSSATSSSATVRVWNGPAASTTTSPRRRNALSESRSSASTPSRRDAPTARIPSVASVRKVWRPKNPPAPTTTTRLTPTSVRTRRARGRTARRAPR